MPRPGDEVLFGEPTEETTSRFVMLIETRFILDAVSQPTRAMTDSSSSAWCIFIEGEVA